MITNTNAKYYLKELFLVRVTKGNNVLEQPRINQENPFKSTGSDDQLYPPQRNIKKYYIDSASKNVTHKLLEKKKIWN